MTETTYSSTTSDPDWSTDLEVRPERPKRGVPAWVWGCGGGCLLVGIAVVACVWWVGSKISGAMDPETRWEQIDRILPHDDRPAQIEPMFDDAFFRLPILGWILPEELDRFAFSVMKNKDDDTIGFIGLFPEGSEAALHSMFDPPPPGAPAEPGDIGHMDDAEYGELTLQGRETRCVSGFVSPQAPWAQFRDFGIHGGTPQLVVSFDVEGQPPMFGMFFGAGRAAGSEAQRMGAADVEAFLKGFRVWDRGRPQKGAPVPAGAQDSEGK